MAEPVRSVMTHRRAVATMVLVTFLWSIAGVVTRHLDSARSFEVTFWRSAANALVLALWLLWQRGARDLWTQVRTGGAILWASGLCWGVMFTAFMVALTLTSVANVLVTSALVPLLTALLARLTLGHRLPARTWMAIFVAGAGIAWMYGSEVSGSDPRHLRGILVAVSVPMAAAVMWTLLQRNAHVRRVQAGTENENENENETEARAPVDLAPAVLIGAILSSLVTLPLSWPLGATLHDISLLAMLGVVQLAVPCVLAVAAGKVLKAPEAALLGLLEVIFGVALTWAGTTESPSVAVVGGGLLVVVALAGNEAAALWGRRGARLAA